MSKPKNLSLGDLKADYQHLVVRHQKGPELDNAVSELYQEHYPHLGQQGLDWLESIK